MAVRYYKTGGKRYYVIEVTGYAIDPSKQDSRAGTGARPPGGTTYAVLDRDWCHREMAVFCPPGPGRRSSYYKRQAEKLADELNRKDS